MKPSNTRLVIVAAILLMVSSSGFLGAVAGQEELGFLKIIGTEYPIQVPRSYSFTVRLVIEYGFHGYFEFYPAIYEGGRGHLDRPLWQGTVEEGVSVGEKRYEITLESPSSEGEWIITAYVFLRETTGSHYFSDPERGPGFAEISIKVADSTRLALRAPYANVPVVVDDVSLLTDSTGTITRELRAMSTHTVIAPQNITIAEGWRAVFVSWNETDNSISKTILMTTDVVMTLDLRDEFYLDIASEDESVEGAGWYTSGSVANFSAITPVPMKSWEGILGVQRKFAGWSGDVESSAPNESIVMDRPHRVVANWTTDYEGAFSTTAIGLAIAVLAALGTAVYVIRRTRRESSTEAPPVPVRAFCMFCGADIDPDARHCSKCGRSQISSD